MSINDECEGMKFIWTIENFSYSGHLREFFGTSLSTAWKVKMRKSFFDIDIFVEKWFETINEFHEISCSVAFLDSNAKPLIRKEMEKSASISNFRFFKFIEIERLNSNKSKFLPNDTLTVECQIWRTPQGLLSWFSRPQPIKSACFSRTRVESTAKVIKKRFSWDIVGVSSLQPHQSFIRNEELSNLGNKLILTIKFILKEDGAFKFICSTDLELNCQIKIEIVVLDASDKKIEFASCEYNSKGSDEEEHFNSFVTKSILMCYPNQFFPGDTLFLQFNCTFSKNVFVNRRVDESNILEDLRRTIAADALTINQSSQSLTPLQDLYRRTYMQAIRLQEESEILADFSRSAADVDEISEDTVVRLCADELEVNIMPSLELSNTIYQDLQEVLKEGFLSDFNLGVGDRVFPVHKVILAARSRRFRVMFTTEKKEDNFLEIQDVDEDTLQTLLHFIYSNTLDEDMGLERALSLYAAANEYAVDALKQRCSVILQLGIWDSNVLEMLALDDTCQDQDLKSAAFHFLSLYNFEIIDTERWKEFEGENQKLALETWTCCRMYLKKMSG